MNNFRLLIVLFIICNIHVSSSYCYDVKTHEEITKNAFIRATYDRNFLKDIGYRLTDKLELKDYNQFTDDYPITNSYSMNKTIIDWARYGSNIEDATITRLDEKFARYANHFYDPINNSGLDCKTCIVHVTGLPAPNWALEQTETGAVQTISGQNYSLEDAKVYYKTALTAAAKIERDNNLALTFKTLGHVIHTVEDMAQPQHTRNDAHGGDIIGSSYGPQIFGEKSIYESYVNDKIGSIAMAGYLPPVFDSYRKFYTSVNADGTMGDGTGLADFSNRSFVTAGTNFACLKENVINGCDGAISEGGSPNKYQSPVFKSDMKTEIPANQLEGVNPEFTDPVIFFGNLITDAYTKKEFINNLMTTYSIFDIDLKEKNKSPAFTLNRFNYFEMAGILLPRAVGYSAGLLNQFFRGDINLQEDGSGYVIVNNTEEDMEGTFKIYYDNKDNERILLWSSEGKLLLEKNSTGNNKSSNIQFPEPEPSTALKPGRYILVFEGSLGGENTVVGKVTQTPTDPYIMIMPVNHETREILPKKYYFYKAKTNTFSSVSDLPFTLLDDGGYWDSISRTWTKKTDRESLGVSLGTGGPQYTAKYWEEENQRVRYVPNLSYEKEAYLSFHLTPTDSSGTIKDINYINYIGSPLFAFGMYNENTGWMEYTGKGLYAILSPIDDPSQRLFSSYRGNNFNDVFIKTPSFRFYDFNGRSNDISIPQDPEAPFPSIVSAYMPAGEEYVKVSTPKVFNNYVKPNPVWRTTSIGSSGLDHYRLYAGGQLVSDENEYKCTAEDENCGYLTQKDSSVKTVFDIPYNFNTFVRVHRNEWGKYYEELYINGAGVQASTISSKADTHYQVLAAYKDTAIVRETNYVSTEEIPLDYRLESNRIYERHWNFTSKYYIYINGKRYDLQGATNTTTKHLNVPYFETASGAPRVDYLTYEPVDDITGYHLDRIFISDTFDGSYVLVAFDEYAYNNGSGLVHDMKYEPSDSDATKHILYYDIPKTEIQNADHEAIRTGRKLLLFKADGTLKQELQDPIGLDKTIGSIGILN